MRTCACGCGQELIRRKKESALTFLARRFASGECANNAKRKVYEQPKAHPAIDKFLYGRGV